MKKMQRLMVGIALLALTAIPSSAMAIFSSVYPVDLSCEYLKNPLGLDAKTPRLFWKLEAKDATDRSLSQSAYQVEVASSERALKQGKADLWDSGTVKSSETTHIEYEGEALRYPMNCWWKVRVADQRGNWSAWSEPAFWTVGPLQQKDWNALWVGADQVFAPSKDLDNPEPSMANPWIRNTYELERLPQSALMYVASYGYHELYVNGLKVGDEVLSPSVSDLSQKVLYKTYDIAPYLQEGKNCVVFWLGVGWSAFEAYSAEDKVCTPMVMAQADLFFSDKKGTTRTQWLTDGTWKTLPSPSYLLGEWGESSFGGELYDATKELEGWNTPELDDSNWNPVKLYTPQVRVAACNVEGNKRIGTLKPKSLELLEDGIIKIDMGCNYTGWLKFKMKGEKGKRVDMHWSERADSEETFSQVSAYIFGDSGEGVFEHRFNYATGRWIYVTGLDYLPDAEDISGYVITTDYERAGMFKSNNEWLNRIYNTALWTFENLSLGGYVVDCPDRSRMGAGEVANATLETGLGNYSLGALYYKWATDWRDVQSDKGDFPSSAPTYQGDGGASSSSFIVRMPWELYLRYGDRRILEETYPSIQRWLAFIERNSKDNLWEGSDAQSESADEAIALDADEEDVCTKSCCWVYNLKLAAQIADVLGLVTDAEAWNARAAGVRDVINKRFLKAETGTYLAGSLADQTAALLSGTAPNELKGKVWGVLAKDALQPQSPSFYIEAPWNVFLFKLLQQDYRNDLIYPLVASQEAPSWVAMLREGETSFGEDWKGDFSSEDQSLLHGSSLFVGNWFIEGLGGIKAPRNSEERGFRHFVIEPGYLKDQTGLTQVESSYNSIAGNIVSNWEVRHHKMFAKVVVPPNCTAEMRFPVSLENVFESAEPVTTVKGVTLGDPHQHSVTLGSGTYLFEIWLK